MRALTCFETSTRRSLKRTHDPLFLPGFGLGEDDTGIATVDADGVARGAIQALYARLQQQQDEIRALKAKLDQLLLEEVDHRTGPPIFIFNTTVLDGAEYRQMWDLDGVRGGCSDRKVVEVRREAPRRL